MDDRLKMSVAVRLSRYLQVAGQAARAGRQRISSQQISKYTGVNATQVRRDLSSFGKFGKRGSGYEIETLCRRLREILGVGGERTIVIVGAGRVGEALVRSDLFSTCAITVAAIFDRDPGKIGRRIGDLTVRPLDELGELVASRGVEAGVVAVPAPAAQAVANALVAAGVTALLNYSEALLDVPAGVSLQTVNPAAELLSALSLQTGI